MRKKYVYVLCCLLFSQHVLGERAREKFKVILIGPTYVGKTAALKAFRNEPFSSDFVTTVGVDYATKDYILVDKKQERRFISLGVWDTAGQERFDAITSTYYRGIRGALIFFDLSNRESFEKVDQWHQKLMDNREKDDNNVNIPYPIYLIAAKNDLVRVVSDEEIVAKVKELGLTKAFAISSKTNPDFVQEMFKMIAVDIINQWRHIIRRKTAGIALYRPADEPQKSGCCN